VSVKQVGRVLGKARTLQKVTLGLEETRHPAEDEAWVYEVAEGHLGYLKSIRWYSVCLQLSQTGYEVQYGTGHKCNEVQMYRVCQKGQKRHKACRGCGKPREQPEVLHVLF